MNPEQIFDRGEVKIDNSKAVIHGITYPVRAISSFSITGNRFGPATFLGALLFIVGVGMILAQELASLLVGAALLIFAVWLFKIDKPKYFLNLVTNAGERRVLETQDKDFIFAIREALNRAIASPQ